MENTPRVSIGMPVYNAEALIGQALDRLLMQTFSDFELIISDNASTDGTWAICEAYARKDSRIRLYRNEYNRGSTYNFNHVLELSQGEYFMWAAHDDRWEPEFLEKCVDGLDTHLEAVLAFTGILLSREYVGENSVIPLHFQKQASEGWRRIGTFLRHPEPKNPIFYGLYRRRLLEQPRGLTKGIRSDTLWLSKCALEGTFVQLEPVLFTYYYDKKRDIRSRLQLFSGKTKPSILDQLKVDWSFIRQLLTITWRAAPNLRARLHLSVVSWHYIWRILGWPISFRLLQRYGSLLLPEMLYRWGLQRKSG
jgi:glycosyltransferase involved in cell wall biosynthesis